jgi:hypothetical protein
LGSNPALEENYGILEGWGKSHPRRFPNILKVEFLTNGTMTTLETKVVSVEKRLEELEETLDILGDKKTVRSIERGLRDLQLGRFRRYENVDELLKGIKHG